MKRLSFILALFLIAAPTLADSPKRKPIKVPEPHAQRIMKIGELAGIAQVCGISWAGYYISFLKSENKKAIWSAAQLKNVAAIFAFSQSKAVRETKTCPVSQKEQIRTKIQKGT
ncbi:MAG: hypothetical protein HOB79_21470 [Rhodospirillaceae bacterium]|jgi:hypothetical protein|nr:hypothetical protein [Rhodospirillaceae bacterium]MBT4703651.1 hypothetical protein [Rhodospirillaceae bacterium]MBT5036015.1 hypothetical protein [Rhodospirillaceae bacterium]MBT6220601.1 hypothetical protein [Rhodospirillaceae bacterium]MBT6364234.1 hypothetical protein [Rhodospirillaceae bacterium]